MPSSVIKPAGPIFRVAAQRRAIDAALDATAEAIQADFDETTATWKHGVDFAIEDDGAYARRISTADAIYGMLNEGTPEHLILPKRGKVLRFSAPFRPKTIPRSIHSGPGSVGGQTVYSRGVNHPGTEARDWDTTIAKTWRDVWPERLQDAINESLR